MKYILNESKIKTTNNFKINDISIDLNIPNENNYDLNKSFSIEKVNDFNSKIGLKHDVADKVEININEDKNDVIEYNINSSLIQIIIINIDENITSNLVIKFMSKEEVFSNVKVIVNTKNNSNLNLTIINLLDNNSNFFLAIENTVSDNSFVKNNFIDIGSNTKISNINSILKNNSEFYLNNIYYGKDNNIIDLNYNVDLIGNNSKGYITVEGILDDNAKKSFKGIIDFKEGAKESIGSEYENVLLLSDTSKSKSLPMLLCHEEDVIGNHGVSVGKLDDEKLFYLMSRGFSKKEAEKLIVDAKFNKIISNINNEKIIDELKNMLIDIIK